jgi:YbgC/YbaW family acyl-CoA thioester hydrolase
MELERKRLVSEVRVRSCHVDSFGHVNNAVYLQFCEGARNDYLLERGLSFASLAAWNAGPVLTRANLEFKRPARTDDRLLIYGEVRMEGRVRFWIRHEIVDGEGGAKVCLADLEFVFVALDTGKPVRVPPPFMRAFDLE